jgi:anaerobic magnesium-protoporphyrin IX monomethyl ester cyclase
MKRNLYWTCTARCDRADAETLRLMKASGCIRLFFGVESGDPRMLEKMRKGETLADIERGIRLAEEANIVPDLGFIIGLPGETAKTIQNTIDFAKRHSKSPMGFTLATPFPGTKFYEQARKEGYEVKDWALHSLYNISYVPPGMTARELQRQYARVMKEVFLRPTYILRQLFQFHSFLEFRIALRLTLRLVFNRFKTIRHSLKTSRPELERTRETARIMSNRS